MIRSVMPVNSSACTSCSGSSGSSIGCVVNQKCSRKSSDGLRSRCGTSSRMADHAASIDHMSGPAHEMPASTSTTCRSGKRAKTPSASKLVVTAAIPLAYSTCSSR